MSAAYRARIDAFLTDDVTTILGHLANASTGHTKSMQADQIKAWRESIQLLRSEFHTLVQSLPTAIGWTVFLEYEIPRRARRPDVVLIAHDLVIVIECKIGSTSFSSSDRWQAQRYAMDLRDFHSASAGRRITSVLWATGCSSSPSVAGSVWCVGQSGMSEVLRSIWQSQSLMTNTAIAVEAWEQSSYRPTPSIIDAATSLFGGHQVANISHSFATNLSKTTSFLIHAVEHAKRQPQRAICFVTGIPGAGKTLTGLAAVHDPAIRNDGAPAAVFLSGNGPLVKIVREALIRDEQSRGVPREVARHRVSAFIDNVHRFIRTYGIDSESATVSYENVIVFDEAQRAWDAKHMYRKNGIRKSEAELVLEIMEQQHDWCVVIALVGGGQEINTGEAGLEEWGRALNARTKAWTVYVSPEAIEGGDTVAGHRLFGPEVGGHISVLPEEQLNLTVNTRSHRARWLGAWVNRFVDDGETTPEELGRGGFVDDFPICFTRDLRRAKSWLLDHSDDTERFGLLASSGAIRLRAKGIEVSSGFRGGYSYPSWFLNDRGNVRSSHQLEVAATEFECQGLELDWTCVCWGNDFVPNPKDQKRWSFHRFVGSDWQTVRVAVTQQYIRNKYRVLLTRARQGMVVWVPQGAQDDRTRDPKRLNAVADRLRLAGVPEIC